MKDKMTSFPEVRVGGRPDLCLSTNLSLIGIAHVTLFKPANVPTRGETRIRGIQKKLVYCTQIPDFVVESFTDIRCFDPSGTSRVEFIYTKI